MRIHRSLAGRGPTRAKAFYRDNIVVIVLEEALTRAERTLVEQGRSDTALELRRQLRRAMRPRLVEAIEHLTGRTVVAFLSDSETNPDVTGQVFVLDAAL